MLGPVEDTPKDQGGKHRDPTWSNWDYTLDYGDSQTCYAKCYFVNCRYELNGKGFESKERLVKVHHSKGESDFLTVFVGYVKSRQPLLS